MKREIHALVLAVSMLVAISKTAAQQAPKPLSNADIVSMVKAGLAENVIVGSIMVSGGNFDVSPNGLISLNKAGVSMRVMETMIESGAPKSAPLQSPSTFVGSGPAVSPASNVPASFVPTAYSAAPGAGQAVGTPYVTNVSAQFSGQMPGQMPGQIPGQIPEQIPGQMPGQMLGSFPGMEPQPTVTLVADPATIQLQGERLQSVQVVSKGANSGNMGGSAALSQIASSSATDVSNGMTNSAGAATVSTGINVLAALLTRKSAVSTYIWALRGKVSSNYVPVQRPRFEVSFADIPGVDPDEFEPHIVRLESTKNNLRLLGATRVKDQSASNNGSFGMIYSSFFEHEIDAEKKVTTPGHMQIAPSKSLPPGEYAVVLRPVSAKKTFSGDTISRNDGEGMLFNMVWSFSVKEETKPPLVASK